MSVLKLLNFVPSAHQDVSTDIFLLQVVFEVNVEFRKLIL